MLLFKWCFQGELEKLWDETLAEKVEQRDWRLTLKNDDVDDLENNPTHQMLVAEILKQKEDLKHQLEAAGISEEDTAEQVIILQTLINFIENSIM